MNNLPKWRFIFVVSILAVAAGAILFFYGRHLIKDGKSRSKIPQTTEERGQIVDRNGRVLATQVRRYDIYVEPPRINASRPQKIEKLAGELAPFLDMSAAEIEASISANTREFLLKKQISMDTWEQIKSAQSIREDRLTGVTSRAERYRTYPEKTLASQILGFMGDYYKPLEGLEFAYDRELSGAENGGKGSKLVLTIDANVQHILEQVSESVMRETQAESVMFLAMDPRNGEILGSAGLPGFDPNDYRASPRSTYLNLSALEHYEPGSVFKVFSISALMDAGAITEQTEFI